LLLLVGGCSSKSGSSSTTDGSVNGAVLGTPLSAHLFRATTVFLPKNTSGVNETGDDLTVLHVSVGTADDVDGYCTTVAKKQATALTFDAYQTGSAVTAGTFQVAGTNTKPSAGKVEVEATRQNDQCNATTASDRTDGASGTLTVSEIDRAHVKGSFDVKLSTGEAVSGTFDVALCPSPSVGAKTTCG
jgi:hypothetical protein